MGIKTYQEKNTRAMEKELAFSTLPTDESCVCLWIIEILNILNKYIVFDQRSQKVWTTRVGKCDIKRTVEG